MLYYEVSKSIVEESESSFEMPFSKKISEVMDVKAADIVVLAYDR